MSEARPIWCQAEDLAHKLAQLDLLLSTFVRCSVVEEFDEKEVIVLLGLASDLCMECRSEADAIVPAAQAIFQQAKARGEI